MLRPISSIFVGSLILSASFSARQAIAADDSELAEDEQLLKSQGVAVDGPGLLEFFRKKTPSAAELARIPGLIRQLGDEAFPIREKASKDLIGLGSVAVPELTQALKDPDLETRRRAEKCLEEIKNGPGAPTAAAARLLNQRRPEGTAAVLFDFLPFAGDESVEEEIFTALMVLGVREGKVDPALAAALSDKAPLRRGAAAALLGRYGSTEQKPAVRALLADADLRVRFRAAQGLLAAREPGALPVLMPLLSEAPLDLAFRIEDLLSRAAGDKAPKVALGEDKDSRHKCREAWEAWWKDNENKIDLAKADVDLSPGITNQQVQQVVHRFVKAFINGDTPVIKKTVAAPFIFPPLGQTFNSVDEIADFVGQLREERPKYVFTVRRVTNIHEHLKTASEEEKKYIDQWKFPKLELRAVYVVGKQNGGEEEVTIFVRVSGGQPRVVGIGEYKPSRK